jgi:trigger factor
MGVPPQRLAQQWAEDGRLSAAAGEVLRGKAVNLIAERVKVTDASGQPVDIKAALEAPAGSEQDDDEDEDGDDADEE